MAMNQLVSDCGKEASVSQFFRASTVTAALFVLYLTGGWIRPVDASPEDAKSTQSRTDQYGDALPDGSLARMGTVRFRHVDGDDAVAISPDGKLLASGGRSNLRVWDLPSGKLRRIVANPSRPNESGDGSWADDKVEVKALGFFSDGRLWSFASNQKRALLYEPYTGKVIHQVPWHYQIPKAVSPDGKLVAIVDSSLMGVEVMSLVTGKVVCKLGHPDRAIFNAGFSPDGKSVATCEMEGEDGANFVRLWTVPDGKEMRTIPVPDHTAYSVSYTPDGKTLIASQGPRFQMDQALQGDFSLVAIDALTGKKWRSLGSPPFTPLSMAFSPDGKVLAGAEGPVIRLLDINAGKMVGERRGHESPVSALAYATDGRTLVSTSGDGTIRFWNSSTGEQQRSIDMRKQGLKGVAFSADGQLLAFVDDRKVPHTVDLPTGRVRRSFKSADADEASGKIALSPDGKILAIEGSYAGAKLHFWDTVSGLELKRRESVEFFDLALDTNFGKVAGVIDYGRTITVRDLATGAEHWRASINSDNQVVSLKFSPDGMNLAAGLGDQSIRLWDARSGKSRGWAVNHASDLPKKNMQGVRQLHFGGASFAFSPDGKTIASGGYDSTVRLWDTTTAKELQCFTGHQGRINAVAFSPDGKTMASGSEDCSVLVWNLARQPK